VGNAAVVLDPDDVAEWTSAMIALVNDESRRHALRDAGLARAAAFTWARSARLSFDVYRRVTGE